MINIDTRLLPKVDEKEFWFLIHIVKRIGVNGTCWPSNSTLCKDTGWGIDTVQKVKKSLNDKGLLKITNRSNSSNLYKVMSDYLGVYIQASDVEMAESGGTGNSGIPEIPGGDNSGRRGGDNSGIEVLYNEVLSNSTESEDSVNKEPELFSSEQTGPEQTSKSKARKKKKEAAPAVPFYKEFVKAWFEEYPLLAKGFNKTDGNKIKLLINHTQIIIEGTPGRVVTTETMEGTFRYMMAYAKREHHFLNGKNLSKWESMYFELYNEIKNGKQKSTFEDHNSRNSAANRFSEFSPRSH